MTAEKSGWELAHETEFAIPEGFVIGFSKRSFSSVYFGRSGTPERIQTSDLLLRREMARRYKLLCLYCGGPKFAAAGQF
jgi:hypothetical protein